MNRSWARLREAILPAAVFLAVLAGHLGYRVIRPARDPAQDRWVSAPGDDRSGRLAGYVRAQEHWMGLSHGLSGAFVTWVLRRFLRDRQRVTRTAAAGGISLSGVLVAGGCFLTGCCGSPMLAVYLGLLGSWFLPLAKPLCAALTLVALTAGWWWVRRKCRPVGQPCEPCADARCDFSTASRD